jgi:hypothetical protein
MNYEMKEHKSKMGGKRMNKWKELQKKEEKMEVEKTEIK